MKMHLSKEVILSTITCNKSMITNTEVRLCRRNVLIRRKLQFVHLYVPQQSFLHAKKRDKNARVIWSYME